MTYRATAEWLRGRLAFGLALGCVPWAVWLMSLALGGWRKDSNGQLVGADHLAFYHAAKLAREGRAQHMYDYAELNAERYQRQIIGWDWGGFEAYRNPPFYALLYTPTAGLTYYQSFVAWSAIGFALLALATWLLRPRRLGRVCLWALAFFPVFATVSFGQNTLISLAIFAGVYRLLSEERKLGAGLVAGLLFFKPQLLLGLFVWWALEPRRYWRCWVGTFITGCALAAVSWAVVPGGSRAFLDTIRTNAAFSGFGLWNVVNPKTFFAILLPGLTGVAWALGGLCSLAGIAVAWWVKRRTGAPVTVMFPVAVFLSLWASPHALVYEWALLVAAAVVLWERVPAARDEWLCLFALAWGVLSVGSGLALAQTRLGFTAIVQVAVPVLGTVGWLAARALVRAPPEQP
ncbi:MAG: glycosyltransferase family 87 protein [Gemmata sp.]